MLDPQGWEDRPETGFLSAKFCERHKVNPETRFLIYRLGGKLLRKLGKLFFR